MFTRDYLINSYWYKARLKQKQRVDVALWHRHGAYLDTFLADPANAEDADRLGVAGPPGAGGGGTGTRGGVGVLGRAGRYDRDRPDGRSADAL